MGDDVTIDYRVQLVLADRGTVDKGSGGLNLLNAGWSWSRPESGQGVSMVLAAVIEVPWDRCNQDLVFTLRLCTDDWSPVCDPSGRPVEVTQRFRVAPRPGAPSGSTGVGTLLLEFPSPGLPLQPRRFYHWQASIDTQHNDQWQVTFWVDGD